MLFGLLTENLELKEAGGISPTDKKRGKLHQEVFDLGSQRGENKQALSLASGCNDDEPAEQDRLKAQETCTSVFQSFQSLVEFLVRHGPSAQAILGHQGSQCRIELNLRRRLIPHANQEYCGRCLPPDLGWPGRHEPGLAGEVLLYPWGCEPSNRHGRTPQRGNDRIPNDLVCGQPLRTRPDQEVTLRRGGTTRQEKGCPKAENAGKPPALSALQPSEFHVR
jgi:hypothetical protein